MQLILLKQIQLFCVTLFITGNINCDHLLLQNDRQDTRIYEVSACSSQCLAVNKTSTLEDCYSHCSGPVMRKQYPVQRISTNLDVKFICRDDTSFVLEIITDLTQVYTNQSKVRNFSKGKEEKKRSQSPNIYVIKIYENVSLPLQQQIIMSNTTLIKIDNLFPNTTYNLSAAVVYGNDSFSLIKTGLQFATLKKRYIPKEISDVDLLRFQPSDKDNNLLSAIITWKPAKDMTCFYDILCFAPQRNDFDITPFEVRRPENLYTYTIENLNFGTEYRIGVRGKNTKDSSRESDLVWHKIETPTCLKWHNNDITICPPMVPEELIAEEHHITGNEFSINITWTKPSLIPDYYILKISDLNPLDHIEPNSLSFNVTKDRTTHHIDSFTLNGLQYEVILTSFSAGGNESSTIRKSVKGHIDNSDKYHVLRLLVAIVAPILSIAVVSLLILLFCHRRAKLKRYQQRFLQELEKKAPVDPNSNFEFSTKNLPVLPSLQQLNSLQQDLENKLGINDEMEVDRGNVLLLEVLGEGAFGLVRKGILKRKDAKELEVAVKTLKDHPSPDDVKEFRREIEVMKGVGEHQNIVGILGHCTKNLNEMCLLTEYCSYGNLLNFLRSEWNYINKLKHNCEQDEDDCLTPYLTAQKDSENVFNFDTSLVDKISIKYKMINEGEISSTSEDNKTEITDKSSITTPRNLVINKLYDLNKSCTSSCKCKVDVISDECLDENAVYEEQQRYKISITNCECGSIKHGSDEEPSSPLLIENKGYYKLLSNNSNTRINDQLPSTKPNKWFRQPLTSGDLLHIAKQIATGMEFLSKNKVVHRDLAARNVLVCEDRTVKIADFGLSRDVYQENMYKKTGTGKLPIKWLALESLTHQIYTTQSDVWSYGILLYEITTLGGTPYPTVPTNRLVKLLKTGYRMEKPKNCSQPLYNLMLDCWQENRCVRPNFSEICNTLDSLLLISPEDQIIDVALTESNKRSKSSSDDSYLKPL